MKKKMVNPIFMVIALSIISLVIIYYYNFSSTGEAASAAYTRSDGRSSPARPNTDTVSASDKAQAASSADITTSNWKKKYPPGHYHAEISSGGCGSWNDVTISISDTGWVNLHQRKREGYTNVGSGGSSPSFSRSINFRIEQASAEQKRLISQIISKNGQTAPPMSCEETNNGNTVVIKQQAGSGLPECEIETIDDQCKGSRKFADAQCLTNSFSGALTTNTVSDNPFVIEKSCNCQDGQCNGGYCYALNSQVCTSGYAYGIPNCHADSVCVGAEDSLAPNPGQAVLKFYCADDPPGLERRSTYRCFHIYGTKPGETDIDRTRSREKMLDTCEITPSGGRCPSNEEPIT